MPMRFQVAIEGTRKLTGAYCRGLQALKRIDRKRIVHKSSKRVTGSLDLDTALSSPCPNDPRWDYGIGIRKTANSDYVVWVEVHPASSTHIDDVLKKLAWLRQWLVSSGPLLRKLVPPPGKEAPPTFVWIASGKVHLQPGSQQRKKLAMQGLHFSGRRLCL